MIGDTYPAYIKKAAGIILTVLLTAGLCLFPVISVHASAAETIREGVLVQDDASLLTEDDIASLQDICDELRETSGWDAMALTVADAEGYDTGDYADVFFLDHCSQDNGFVAVIDMDNREIYAYTSGEAIDYLTDARIETILDHAYEYVSDGQYFEALRSMLTDAGNYYQRGIPDGTYRYDEETGEVTYYKEPNALTQGELLLALAAGLICAAAIFLVTAGKYQMKLGGYSYDYKKESSLKVARKADRFVNRFVTRRRIPKNPPSGGGGGGGSTVHHGPSGHSHGGGGRSF